MSDSDVTKVEGVPPHETSASPVEVSIATPRYFGLTPPTLLFGIATATLAIAIFLAVLRHWIVALVLAVAVLLEIALFVSVARRKPDTTVARMSTRTLDRARQRAAWLVESAGVRTETSRRLTSFRRELLQLGERRDRALRDLGAAVYAGDDAASGRLREELGRIDEQAKEREDQIATTAEAARKRLREGRLSIGGTVIERPEDEQ